MKLFHDITVAIDVGAAERRIDDESLLSPASQGALEKALWLAGKSDAALHVMTSLDLDARAESLVRREEAAGAEGLLRAARERLERITAPLRAEGRRVTSEVAFGRAWKEVVADVVRHRRDLVVVGTRERGAVARNLLGSTSLQLLRHSPVAVWVARSAPRAQIRVVLAPVDVGDMAPSIVSTAAALAAECGARLVVVHALDPTVERAFHTAGFEEAGLPRVGTMWRDEARVVVEGLVIAARRQGIAVETRVEVGHPADVIVAEAGRCHADLVVLGSVVHGVTTGVLLGSTTEKVLPQLATSLLVLKPVTQPPGAGAPAK